MKIRSLGIISSSVEKANKSVSLPPNFPQRGQSTKPLFPDRDEKAPLTSKYSTPREIPLGYCRRMENGLVLPLTFPILCGSHRHVSPAAQGPKWTSPAAWRPVACISVYNNPILFPPSPISFPFTRFPSQSQQCCPLRFSYSSRARWPCLRTLPVHRASRYSTCPLQWRVPVILRR